MRSMTRLVLLGAAVLALAASMATSAGCGGGSPGAGPSPKWEEVVTSKVSGKAPVKLNLGTHELGTSVRLAWKLSGPDKPPVVLTFRIINADYGMGFGHSVTPQDQGLQVADGQRDHDHGAQARQLHRLLQPAVPARPRPRLRRRDHRLHTQVAAAPQALRGRRPALRQSRMVVQSGPRTRRPRGRRGKGAGTMTFTFGPRRGIYVDITDVMTPGGPLTPAELDHFEAFDLLYRSLCALLFNYVPTSGHPGGSISSGRAVAARALRLPRLRPLRPGPAGRRPHQLRGRPQGHGPVRDVGAARRAGGGGRPGAAARKRGAAPAHGGPPRLPPQPHHGHAAVPPVRRPRARRTPDAGDAVRQARHRRLRRGRRQLHRPRSRRRRPLRRRRPARTHRRG